MTALQEMDMDPFDTARYCLRYLKPRRDRDGWIMVGMACQSVGDGLLSDWLAWSAQSDDFEEYEARRQWRTFEPGKETLQTLINMAKTDGAPWPPPNATPCAPSKVKSFLPRPFFRGKPLVRVYPFSETYVRVRYGHKRGDSDVIPFSFNGTEWVNEEPKRDDGGLLSLYREADIYADIIVGGSTIYVVEDEKAADAIAIQLDLVGISCGGLNDGDWRKYDWTVLRGCRVVILPVNDKSGARYATELAKHLVEIADQVTVAPPFRWFMGDVNDIIAIELDEGADIVEWLGEGRCYTKRQLVDLLAEHVAQGEQQPRTGDIAALSKGVIKGIRETQTRGWLGLRLPTFKQLDNDLCGLRGLMVLGAAPGIGKTQLAIQLSIDALKDPMVGVIYLSLEMTSSELATRLLTFVSNLSYRRLRLGDQDIPPYSGYRLGYGLNDFAQNLKLSDQDIAHLANGVMTLGKLGSRMDIYSMADLRTMQGPNEDPVRWYERLSYLIQRVKERMEVERLFVVVDNLQAVAVEGPHGDEWPDDMAHDRFVIEGLSRLQQETGEAILVTSELKDGGRFKDSAGIEGMFGTDRIAYRADIVMRLSRTYERKAAVGDSRHSQREYDKYELALQIDKGRDGVERGEIRMRWNENWSSIREA